MQIFVSNSAKINAYFKFENSPTQVSDEWLFAPAEKVHNKKPCRVKVLMIVTLDFSSVNSSCRVR